MASEDVMPTSSRRAVGTGAMVTTLGSVGTAIAGGLLGIAVARILGPADMGIYTLASTTLFVLLTVATLGIQTGTTYFAAGRGWRAEEAFPQVQVSAAAVGAGGAVVGAVVAAALSDSLFKGVTLRDLFPALLALPFALSWTFGGALA